jgi:ATP-dependent DNA ligase
MTHPTPEGPTSIASRRGGGDMPDAVRPMLATAAPEPFDSKDHTFELMWGGVRAIAHIRDGVVRLRGSNGIDLGSVFPEFNTLPGMVNAREALLDGEIIAVDPEGQPAFDALRPRLHALALERAGIGVMPAELSRLPRIAGQLCYSASDVLWLDGRSLMERPLWQRKNRLHEIVRPSPEFTAADFVDDEGIAFFDAVLGRKLEGALAKEKLSTYTPGRRSKAWLAIRALQSGDFVIVGYTIGGTHRRSEPFHQLLLGAFEDGRFEYIGSVAGGLNDIEARQVLQILESHAVPKPPFIDPPPVARLTYWTAPEAVCHVRFSEWSRDGYLRFPIFGALRPDLNPEDCSAE